MTRLTTKIVSRVKFLRSNGIDNYFSRTPIYVFHHIPKCGGTSFAYALREWFSVVKDYKTTHLSKTISKRVNIGKLRQFQCLCGHFHIPGIYLHERYPEVFKEEKYKVFTLLRDPLETKISLYYYQRRTNTQPGEMSLEEHLLTEPNWMAARFPLTRQNYKQVLSRYFFIGILEHPRESIDRLADLMVKKRIRLPFENETRRDAQAKNIDPQVIKKFKERNELDYLVYEYCYERFVKDRKATPSL